MPINGLQRTLDRLRIVLAPELPDEQLLKKVISSRDEIAFATLVRRHGKMVLGVSRRILGNLHDSEDVLQATFLVLVQKARLVGNRDALASWHYKVAYRIALKAKARNDRRRQKETQVELMPHPSTASPVVYDWEALLDEELNRLPEKYRLPVILCDLEGRTRKEVEHELKLEAGTLSSRLTRARRMLAERLTRRGVVLSAGVVWAASSHATAALPPKLIAATAQKAVLVAAGQFAAISSSVSILMKAGVKAMFFSKLKAMVGPVVVLAALGAGGLVYSSGGGGQVGQAKPQSELEKLRQENELLKVNLRVTLEKIQVLENEVRTLKGRNRANIDEFHDSRDKQSVTPANLRGSGRPSDLAPDLPDKRTGQIPAYPRDAEKDPSGQTSKFPPDAGKNPTRGTSKFPPNADNDSSGQTSQFPPDAGKNPRGGTSKFPPNAEKNPSGHIRELDRALNALREATERKDRIPEHAELLRHAAETLDRVVKQLRELEQNPQK